MICEVCGKRTATVHVKTMVNGVYTEKHMCSHCAKEYDSDLDLLTPAGIISSMFKGNTTNTTKGKRCPNCGTTTAEFQKSGYLGCSKCYEEFGDVLEPIIRRVQGNVAHVGRVPTPVVKPTTEKEKLLLELDEAVRCEDYQRAAIIRDKIKALEDGKNG